MDDEANLSEELEALKSVFSDDLAVQDETGDKIIVVYKYNSTVHLTLTLSVTSYPSCLPIISVPKHVENLGLVAHLVTVATPLVGSPMLYAMIDSARDWLDGHSLSLTPPGASEGVASSAAAVVTSNVCKFYKQGKCKFGSRCKNVHPGEETEAHTAMTRTQTETQAQTARTETQTKTKARTKAGSKAKIETEAAGTRDSSPKKPSKQDVDHREEEGEESPAKKDKMRTATDVISRILWDPDLPSEEFTVGYLDRFIGIQEKPFKEFNWEDISTLGANVLAVPKHRIQYFKYRDSIVWDKRNQTDNFFGSRGGSTIQDLVSKSQLGDAKGSEDMSLLEVENEDADDHGTPRYHSDINRPTHFVCIHVDSEEVVEEVKKVISHVTKLNPQLSECLISTLSLHVTLCMVRLTTEEQIDRAKQVLQSARLQFISLLPNCMKLSFTGVDNFRERLIYVKVKQEPALNKFVSHLIEQFQSAGLKTPGNHEEYTPHITVVKLSRPMQRVLTNNVINPACYQPYLDTPLGHQPVTSVHLCDMHAPAQEDGFYLRLGTITNSLSGLPHVFPSLVKNQLGLLADMEHLNEQDREQLCKELDASIELQDEEKFDEVLEELARLHKEAATFQSLVTVQPTVVIMRGLPGSGKSYLARNCQEVRKNPTQTAVISADDYFTEGSEYRFNPATAHKAHQYCLRQFLSSLANGCRLVVIDNTNTQLWEYRIYTHVCDVLGYPYYVLEIPPLSPSMTEIYCARNVHNIQLAAVTKMCQRWEEDENRVLAPPQLAYPRDWPSRDVPVYSLISLCSLTSTALPQNVISSEGIIAVYTGVFLSPESQWELLKAYRPTHSDIFASHVTLVFKPTLQQLGSLPVGKKVKIKVVGESDNGRIQAAVVDLPRYLTSENKSPHVTISAVSGVPPKVANAMLQSHLIRQNQLIYLEGVLGVVVRQATAEEKAGKEIISEESLANAKFHTITSPSELKSVLPKVLATSETSSENTTVNEQLSTGILTGEQKVTQLFIFDFDGTLFIPPGNYQGRREYERLTGQKWHHKGWLGHPESLLPPLRVKPGPALPEYRSHSNRAGSYSVVLTGRVDRVRSGLAHVLESAQLFPQRLICKPDVTDETTSSFKQRIVKELLAEFPDVTLVKFWDDIPENLAAIRWLSQGKARHVQFDIIDATKMSEIHGNLRKSAPDAMKLFNSHLESHLATNGLLPTLEHRHAIQEGLDFISAQFAKLIEYRGHNPLNLLYPFGSSPLNRVGDVDVCLLAPPTHTHVEWLTLLAQQLEGCGVNHVHVGHSSRCPRLKILLHFSQTPSIEFDIVVALVSSEEFFKSPSDRKMSPVKIAEMRQAGDSISKIAINGPVFMEQIESVAKNLNVSLETIGALVEMTLQFLMAKREKGNAYHCIRSFHVVKLLIQYLDSHPVASNCDVLFQSFIDHVAEMTFENWKSLCADFVPEEYIPRLISLFQEASVVLKEAAHPSAECYESLLMRRSFPPEGYTPVEIRLSGNNDLKKWKARMIVEARLPTYIRQLLTHGLDVVADGNRNETRFCFAVPAVKSAKDTLQRVLRPFWTEMTDLKKDGLNIHLTFGQSVNTSVPTSTDARTTAVMESITAFVSSEQTELHLPSSLSAHARLLVHETAETLGLAHSSVGKGRSRHVVLKKL